MGDVDNFEMEPLKCRALRVGYDFVALVVLIILLKTLCKSVKK